MISSKYPIHDLLASDKAPCCVLKWAAKLAKYNIKFVARKVIKSGVLAEFIAEWTPHGDQYDTSENLAEEPIRVAFTDGAWGASGARCSVIITSPSGPTLQFSASLAFPTTNNAAEYEGILPRLQQAKALGARRLMIFCDSWLASM